MKVLSNNSPKNIFKNVQVLWCAISFYGRTMFQV